MKQASPPFRLNWITITVVCLFCFAGALRFSSLDNLPGINADEADMGVHVLDMLSGKPFILRSTAGQFYNPIYVLSESLLFHFFGPSFYLLRLPAACCSAIGVMVLIYLFGKIFHDWNGALLLGVVSACLPAEMIYSRLGWDPTFLFFWTPILLYLAMRLINEPHRRHAWLLGISIVLTIWTHSTSASFILAMLAAILWIDREAIAARLAHQLPHPLSDLLVGNGLIFFGWFILIWLFASTLAWFLLEKRFWEVRNLSPFHTLHVLANPLSLIAHLRIAADLFTGYRPIRYVTGMPRSTGFEILNWIVLALLIAAVVKLTVSKNRLNRFLAYSFLFYTLLIIMEAGTFDLKEMSNERYVLPLVILVPVIFVRILPHPIWLAISFLMLLIYWQDFQQPTLQCRYQLTEHKTYWTGPEEPKAQAAKWIARLARAQTAGRNPMVYTSRYWIERPLQLLLYYSPLRVTHFWPGPQALAVGDFVAGFSGEDFTEGVIHDLKLAGREVKKYTISNQSGVEEVVILQITK